MNVLGKFLSRSKSYTCYLPAVIFLLTMILYSPVIWHDFISYDDDVFVYENPNIASGLTLETIQWAFSAGYEANWIPLSMLSHALDIQLFGLNPAGHHLINLLLHAASSCLLFLFLRRATTAQWKSAVVAFLFALHPLRVESVAWVAERKDVLSMLFGMLTIYLYQRYSEDKCVIRYCYVIVCFCLALLSKPMMVTLPLLLILLDWWPLGRFQMDAVSCRTVLVTCFPRLIIEKIPLFILSIGSCFITYRVQQSAGELMQGYDVLSRLGKSCIAYVTYLIKMVWPIDLAILYPFPKYPHSNTIILFSVVLLILITSIAVWEGRRLPFFLTGWLWYVISLLPVIGLIQIGQHNIANRYTYLPLTGVFISLVWGGEVLFERLQNRRAFHVGVVSILIALAIVTRVQLAYWKNNETLYTRTLEITEGNWVIHNNLGLVYLNQGRIDEAFWQFNQSIKAKPSYSLAYLNLGAAYIEISDYKKAVDAFNWSLQFDRASPKAHYGLGVAYLGLGNFELALKEYNVLKESAFPDAESLLEMILAASR